MTHEHDDHGEIQIDRCSVCGEPAHATETDDEDRCEKCRPAPDGKTNTAALDVRYRRSATRSSVRYFVEVDGRRRAVTIVEERPPATGWIVAWANGHDAALWHKEETLEEADAYVVEHLIRGQNWNRS